MAVTESQRRILLWMIVGSLLVPILLDAFPQAWIHFRERTAPGEILGEPEHFLMAIPLQLSQVLRAASGFLLAVWILLRLGIFERESDSASE